MEFLVLVGRGSALDVEKLQLGEALNDGLVQSREGKEFILDHMAGRS